jgi:hypothetical protein
VRHTVERAGPLPAPEPVDLRLEVPGVV